MAACEGKIVSGHKPLSPETTVLGETAIKCAHYHDEIWLSPNLTRTTRQRASGTLGVQCFLGVAPCQSQPRRVDRSGPCHLPRYMVGHGHYMLAFKTMFSDAVL